jgi:type I restriction enzyme, R subunit
MTRATSRAASPIIQIQKRRPSADGYSQTNAPQFEDAGQADLGPWGRSPEARALDRCSGAINEKEKALMAEIIERASGLFDDDLTNEDQLVYVNHVIKGKLPEREQLVTQAATRPRRSSPTRQHSQRKS